MQVVFWWLVVMLVLPEMNVVVEGTKLRSVDTFDESISSSSGSDSKVQTAQPEGTSNSQQQPQPQTQNLLRRNPEFLDPHSQGIVERSMYKGYNFIPSMNSAKEKKGGRWVFWIVGSDPESWTLVGRQVESKEKVSAREGKKKEKKKVEEEEWSPWNCLLDRERGELNFTQEPFVPGLRTGWTDFTLKDYYLEHYSQELVDMWPSSSEMPSQHKVWQVMQHALRGGMKIIKDIAAGGETVIFWVHKEKSTHVTFLMARGFKATSSKVCDYKIKAHSDVAPEWIYSDLSLPEDKVDEKDVGKKT